MENYFSQFTETILKVDTFTHFFVMRPSLSEAYSF